MQHPVQVCPGRGATANVAQGIAAVESLTARRQVDSGERVIDRFRQTHLDTPECVDDCAEPGEPDFCIVIESHAGRSLDCLRQQLRPPFGEGRVDLVGAVARNVHIGVAGDGHHGRRLTGTDTRDVHQQDRVGAAVPEIAAGGQLSLLLWTQVAAAVGPDQ